MTIYFSKIGTARTKEQWYQDYLIDCQTIGIPPVDHWWKKIAKLYELSPVCPDQRKTKEIEATRTRNLDKPLPTPRVVKRVAKSVSNIKGFVPDERTLKQLNSIFGVKPFKEKKQHVRLNDKIINRVKKLLMLNTYSQTQIGKMCNISQSQVHIIKMRHGDLEQLNKLAVRSSSKLSSDQINELVIQFKTTNKSQRQLAKEFNVSQTTVGNIYRKMKEGKL